MVFNFSNCQFFHEKSSEKISSKMDHFLMSDFFFDNNGFPIPPHIVGLRLQSDPELKEKFAQYLVTNEISSHPDLSDDQIIDNIQSQFEDRYSLMERLTKKTLELKKKDIEKQVDDELNK